MSILSKEEILIAIKKGQITIIPFNKENIGPASIDLTLSDEFRLFKKGKQICDVRENIDYKDLTKLIKTNSIILKQRETIIGLTKEKITLSDNICGTLEGRSRFSRLGLMVQISAPFMHPGISNNQALELTNLGPLSLRLYAGTKICQFIFEEVKGKAKYSGLFSKQSKL